MNPRSQEQKTKMSSLKNYKTKIPPVSSRCYDLINSRSDKCTNKRIRIWTCEKCVLIFRNAESSNIHQCKPIFNDKRIKLEPSSDDVKKKRGPYRQKIRKPIEKIVKDEDKINSVGTPLIPSRTYKPAPKAVQVEQCPQKAEEILRQVRRKEKPTQLPKTIELSEVEASGTESSDRPWEYIRCVKCGLEFRNIYIFMQHQKFVCKEILPNKQKGSPTDALNADRSNFPSETKCKTCGLSFPNSSILVKHQMKTCKKQDRRPKIAGSNANQQEDSDNSPKQKTNRKKKTVVVYTNNELEKLRKKREMSFLASWLKIKAKPDVVLDHETKMWPTDREKKKATVLLQSMKYDWYCEICRFYFIGKQDLDKHRKLYCKLSKLTPEMRNGAVEEPAPSTETNADKPLNKLIEDDWVEDEPQETEIDERAEIGHIKVEIASQIKNEPVEEVNIKLEDVDGVQTSLEQNVVIKTEPGASPGDIYPQSSIYEPDLKMEVDLEEQPICKPAKRRRNK